MGRPDCRGLLFYYSCRDPSVVDCCRLRTFWFAAAGGGDTARDQACSDCNYYSSAVETGKDGCEDADPGFDWRRLCCFELGGREPAACADVRGHQFRRDVVVAEKQAHRGHALCAWLIEDVLADRAGIARGCGRGTDQAWAFVPFIPEDRLGCVRKWLRAAGISAS